MVSTFCCHTRLHQPYTTSPLYHFFSFLVIHDKPRKKQPLSPPSSHAALWLTLDATIVANLPNFQPCSARTIARLAHHPRFSFLTSRPNREPPHSHHFGCHACQFQLLYSLALPSLTSSNSTSPWTVPIARIIVEKHPLPFIHPRLEVEPPKFATFWPCKAVTA